MPAPTINTKISAIANASFSANAQYAPGDKRKILRE